MTVDELNRIAFSGADMPENLNTAEQLLYLKLLYLYKLRSLGSIDTARGKQMKAKFVKQFESDLFDERCFEETVAMRNKLENHLTKIIKNGCTMCKKAVQIFDGTYRGLNDDSAEKRG